MSRWSMLTPEAKQALLERIEQHSGIRLQDNQRYTLDRALGKHLGPAPADPSAAVLDFLANLTLPQLDRLVQDLTIHETYFFRGEGQMQQLRERVLPELQQRPYPVRIWSAGCSTGEEAYTLSILLKTEFGMEEATVLGTDLHPEAIRKARQGRYRAWSFRGTPEHLRTQWFQEDKSHWTIQPFLQYRVFFGVLNLKQFPWMPQFEVPGVNLAPLDLIVCRNVTLYFGQSSAQQVYQQFQNLLAKDGMLILGPSDPLPEPQTGLRAEPHPAGWIWRKALNLPTEKQLKVVPQPKGKGSAPHFAVQTRPQPLMHSPESSPPATVLLPDTLEGLRQHVFLHPNDALAVYQLAQRWIKQGEPARAIPLLRKVHQLLKDQPATHLLSPEVTAGELRQASIYALSMLKGNP